ncbi:hypothetical protein L6452_27118 [Arctium lappa]|uniref:Uncharacterized protein n=1 Tax=Arctium lappa TaxID=4217 RepID=A0ACB8ZVT3_ARCLA|nr:hypothetical protein L6452_27118 [Arctium lappa]
MVAASSNHPMKFQIKRNKIDDQTLFSCELIKQVSEDDGSYYYKQQSEIQQQTNIDAEVLKIKDILDKSTPHESESVIYHSLSKLQHMGLSFKTLEATGIGKSVSALKKHESRDVRQIANALVKVWKGVVDEWINTTENMSASEHGEWNIINPPPIKKHSVHACKQQTTTIPKEKLGEDSINKQSTDYLNMETNKFQISEKAKGHVEESKKMDYSERKIEEKLEATKRKLHQGYEEADKKKRQRRIQVIELHQLTQENHILPQTQPVNKRRGNWHC